MSKPLTIDDGQDCQGYAAESDTHGALAFHYRPMPTRAVDKYRGEMEIAERVGNFGKRTDMTIDLVVDRVSSWSWKDSGGRQVSINKANVERLHPALVTRVEAIIQGAIPSDAWPPGTFEGEDAFDEKTMEGN